MVEVQSIPTIEDNNIKGMHSVHFCQDIVHKLLKHITELIPKLSLYQSLQTAHGGPLEIHYILNTLIVWVLATKRQTSNSLELVRCCMFQGLLLLHPLCPLGPLKEFCHPAFISNVSIEITHANYTVPILV